MSRFGCLPSVCCRRCCNANYEMLRRLFIALIIAGLAGCQTPFLMFSGHALRGPVADTDSFAFAAQYKLLQLEVRPDRPYSVFLRVVTRDGQLYIDAAQKRRWHTYLKETPNVRVKLGDAVYLATAVPVDDRDITGQFLAGRTIYRLVPRKRAAVL